MLRRMKEPIHRDSRARLVPAPREDLCLEFANTLSWRGSEHPTEALNGFSDLLAWCEGAKAVDRRTAVNVAAWAKHRKSEAARLFNETMTMRETIYGVFAATASNRPVSEVDIGTLNRLLERAPGRVNLAVAEAATMWRLPAASPTAAGLLAPVLWSVGDLLAGDHLARVRLCANNKCRWLFLDDSKSRTRRWCSMSACGNRAKARRHYTRITKSAREAGELN
jgi:predicted RNA-binding Zn ribbon-like protein